MKSNSIQVRNHVKNHILECVTTSECEKFATLQDAKNYALNRFNLEYNNEYNKRLYPNNQQRFKEYCLGMAFDFTPYFNEQREILSSWGLVKESATDKQICDLYFALIYMEIIRTEKPKKL